MTADQHLTIEQLREACSAGGASVLTSTTPLEPAAGPHASVAPAKFVQGNKAVFAYERRFVDGEAVNAVIIDSKQSQNNRGETAVAQAIADGNEVLGRIPRIRVSFPGGPSYTDLELPHRAFDGHIRSGEIDGVAATDNPRYRRLRDADGLHARALIDQSPMTLLLGGWDASRKSHQGRYRSVLVGEILGVLADQDGKPERNQSQRGGARLDPLGQSIALTPGELKDIADAQKSELSDATYKASVGKNGKASRLGLGGIAPALENLGGVTCRAIIRSHVLSFAALRALRFSPAPGDVIDGVKPAEEWTAADDVACRVVLAALALNLLARSDAELLLRANCDLVESGPCVVTLDKRYGVKETFAPLTIEQADALLDLAIAEARERRALNWDSQVLAVVGNVKVLRAAEDQAQES